MQSVGYATIVTIIIFFLLSLEDNSYKNKSKNGEKYSGDFAEIFLGSLIFLYGTLNPGLNREFHNTLWDFLCLWRNIHWI